MGKKGRSIYCTDFQLHAIEAKFEDVDTGNRNDDERLFSLARKAGKELGRRRKEAKKKNG